MRGRSDPRVAEITCHRDAFRIPNTRQLTVLPLVVGDSQNPYSFLNLKPDTLKDICSKPIGPFLLVLARAPMLAFPLMMRGTGVR